MHVGHHHLHLWRVLTAEDEKMREIAIESSQHSAGIKLWVVLSVSTPLHHDSVAFSVDAPDIPLHVSVVEGYTKHDGTGPGTNAREHE